MKNLRHICGCNAALDDEEGVNDGNVGPIAAEEVAGLFARDTVRAKAGIEVKATKICENEHEGHSNDGPGHVEVGQEGGQGGSGRGVYGAWQQAAERWGVAGGSAWILVMC
jgi:hypothetical protein